MELSAAPIFRNFSLRAARFCCERLDLNYSEKMSAEWLRSASRLSDDVGDSFIALAGSLIPNTGGSNNFFDRAGDAGGYCGY